MGFDIVIVGGGLVGASLASALRSSGLRIALVESAMPAADKPDAETWDSRIYAFTPGNAAFLTDCGAWDRLDKSRVQAVEAMRIFGDTGAKLEFSAYQLGVPELAFILESRLLHQALWQGLREQENVTVFHSTRCASLQREVDGVRLTLQDGREIEASLIVGADGRDSWVRQQAQMPEVPTPYHQHGLVANFSISKPHRGIAYQWFQSDGILALLPLPGRRISIVWSVSPEKSAELMALSHEELCARVSEASQHTLGELSVITAPAAFPLRVLNLAHITQPRLALIGDAAHNVHPLAGQGVNLGLRDVQALVQTLQQRGALDCGDAVLLERYERARREDILSMQLTTDALKHLFVNDQPLLRALRNIGLTATNALLPLKKMLARHALH